MQKFQLANLNDIINFITFAGVNYIVLSGTNNEVIPLLRKIIATHYKNYETGLINIWGHFSNGKYQITISLRSKHRPDCYFTNDIRKHVFCEAALIKHEIPSDYHQLLSNHIEMV